MKRVSLLLVAMLAASLLFAQPKWSLKATGAVGGTFNTETYTTYYGDRYWHYSDRWDDVYDNGKLFYEAEFGFRVYAFRWLYFGADVSYSKFKNSYDFFYIQENNGQVWQDRNLTLEGLGVSFVTGFTFLNNSRFYPFAEIGLMPYFTFNDDFHDKSVYFGTNFKLGGGVRLMEGLALELAFTSTMLYKSGRDRYYYDGYYRYTDRSLEINSGLGVSLGCVVNFGSR